MKKLNLKLTALSVLAGSIMTAQAPVNIVDMDNVRDGETLEYCVQHIKMMEMLKDPAKMKIHLADQEILKQR